MKSSSEIHNLRLKELDYVRKDLTPLNESWFDPRYEGRSIAEIRDGIARRYKETVGQKVQAKMVMFKEGVVVIDENTTMEQLKSLAVAFEEKFGIKTMQIHIHRDEGHQNSKEWKPNLHAHMTFDWTKPNGKSIPSKETPYAKMQTITAEVLGMERGVSSDIEHLNAVQYKNKKEGERLLALQEQNSELQAQVEQYQQSNEQLRSENEELLLKAEEIRKAVATLEDEVKKLNITRKGKQAVLIALNKITDMFGKSDLLLEKEKLEAKVEEGEKKLKIWQLKVEKLQADLDRRTAERDAVRKEKAALEKVLSQKTDEIDNLESKLIKSRKENLRLGRIAEPWKHTLPNVVDVDHSDIIGVPGGHTLRIAIEGHEKLEFYRLSGDDYHDYLNGKVSFEHLIGKYATHDIDVAVARKLQRLSGVTQKSELAKLANTMFHALPSVLSPILGVSVSVSHGTNGYVGIRHKNLDDILQDMIDEGYQIHR